HARMPGGRSIQLARVFGIRIGVNPSWFLVLFLIIWSLSDQYKNAFPGHDSKSFALATASALLLFVCVILHELGHALVAMRNLIPGFPLDGGNIVRAVAWWRTGDRTRATAIAARMGRVFGYLIVAGGVYVIVRYQSIFGGIWLVIVGNFLASAARSTEMQTRL